ncbi:hypothetical protein AYO37_00185 [Opitutia bacterium SCGC AG-212-L18]|nr:hypothetical protein AYO37_00185 [Opitutae bacterium SCGC AG-212-L18]
MNKLSKNELINLVQKIRALEFDTEKELEELLDKFDSNVSRPNASALIYHHEPRLTPEEIVEKALAYKPIILPPPDDMNSVNQR